MAKEKQWFLVDTQGLGAICARRGKAFILFELISNALDAPGTKRVDVKLRRVGATDLAELVVEDDSPEGFLDMEHAYVLFKPSDKKGKAETRGRFAAGEKTAISLMERAVVQSTTGTVRFTERGRTKLASGRIAGSRVWGELKVTDAELEDMKRAARSVLVPEGITLTFNGAVVPYRAPLKTVEATLPTEIDDGTGRLRPTRRKTTINIHRPLEGEAATLHELGIPVVACGDSWTIDVMQKVPLGLDRDSVTGAFLSQLRAVVLEAMTEDLTVEDANAGWVRDAMEKHGSQMPATTVRKLLDLRFGEQRVAYDPSDVEANHRAVAAGYTLVHGRQMSAGEWEAAKRADAIKPAGQVTPSPRPDSEGGEAREYLDESKWTPAIREVAALTRRLTVPLIGAEVIVRVASDVTWPFAATYGARQFTYNLGRLGHRFFEGPIEDILDLIIHETAHELESNHLSDNYYRALTKIGGKMAALALTSPQLFSMRREVVGRVVADEGAVPANTERPTAALA